MKRTLTSLLAFAALSITLIAQPNISLRPDRTVFFYAKDAKTATAAVKADPVVAGKVDALGLPVLNHVNAVSAETIDNAGTMASVSDYCRMDIQS